MQQHGKWMQMLGVLGLIWNVISFMMTIYDTVLENDVTWYARTIWLLFIAELMPECLVECRVHNWTTESIEKCLCKILLVAKAIIAHRRLFRC